MLCQLSYASEGKLQDGSGRSIAADERISQRDDHFFSDASNICLPVGRANR